MTDLNQNTTTQTTTTQTSPTKELFGGNQAVFDNLEKFEQISNPTGDLDFDFAFEEALEQYEKENTPETHADQQENKESHTITFDELSQLHQPSDDSETQTNSASDKEIPIPNKNDNIFQKLTHPTPQQESPFEIEAIPALEPENQSNEDTEDQLTQLATTEKVMETDFSIPQTSIPEQTTHTTEHTTPNSQDDKPTAPKTTAANTTLQQENSIQAEPNTIPTKENSWDTTNTQNSPSSAPATSTPLQAQDNAEETSKTQIPHTTKKENKNTDSIKEHTQRSKPTDNASPDNTEPKPTKTDTTPEQASLNTWTPITTEQQAHQQLEQEQPTSDSKYVQKYWELLQSTQEILALHNKLQNTEEQSFDILGNATPKNQTLYTFSIETAWELQKLLITKIETDLIHNTTTQHTLHFSTAENSSNLQVTIDDFLLYQEEPDFEDAMKAMQVNDKLNKFAFLLGEKLKTLQTQREELQQEKEKQKAFRSVFRNF